MVGISSREHLRWLAVNIDCCRLAVVSRAQWERQLTVTVAVTVAVYLLAVCLTKSALPVFGNRSSLPLCLCMLNCLFAYVCHSLWLCVYRLGL